MINYHCNFFLINNLHINVKKLQQLLGIFQNVAPGNTEKLIEVHTIYNFESSSFCRCYLVDCRIWDSRIWRAIESCNNKEKNIFNKRATVFQNIR